MLRVAYMGRATGGRGRVVLAAISEVSARRNLVDGVTGFLVCDGYHFVQAIEGAEKAVRSCFARILHDPRHYDVRVVADEETRIREFGDWSMLCKATPPKSTTFFVDEVTSIVENVSSAHLRALFIGFASLRRARP